MIAISLVLDAVVAFGILAIRQARLARVDDRCETNERAPVQCNDDCLAALAAPNQRIPHC